MSYIAAERFDLAKHNNNNNFRGEFYGIDVTEWR
jgi:hypothetical protein